MEHTASADDKFPDLPEMLVLMMYKLIDELPPRLSRRLVSLYNTVRLLYSEEIVREVRLQYLNIKINNFFWVQSWVNFFTKTIKCISMVNYSNQW